MPLLFLDSSALVKRYIREPGSDHVRALLDAADVAAIAAVTPVEVAAAVARRSRAGDLPETEGRRLVDAMLRDVDQQFIRIGLGQAIAGAAVTAAWDHALRAYDAVQLASALTAATIARRRNTDFWFVCSDTDLLAAAAAAGMATIDPTVAAGPPASP